MDNPETLATLGTEVQKNTNKQKLKQTNKNKTLLHTENYKHERHELNQNPGLKIRFTSTLTICCSDILILFY